MPEGPSSAEDSDDRPSASGQVVVFNPAFLSMDVFMRQCLLENYPVTCPRVHTTTAIFARHAHASRHRHCCRCRCRPCRRRHPHLGSSTHRHRLSSTEPPPILCRPAVQPPLTAAVPHRLQGTKLVELAGPTRGAAETVLFGLQVCINQ